MTEPSGSRYPNRLITTSSPYLLQHAYNPVNWLPWGADALDKALIEDKPILVSIGYSACHWCHVMEHESFEDEDVAAIMNKFFVCIKVDREERPDIDQLYMEAVQIISGSGGWPLNCFLTPDARPFYGGTYYPPKPAYNRPSWTQLLQHIVRLYQDKRQVVEDQADRLLQAIRSQQTKLFNPSLMPGEGKSGPNRVTIDQIFHRIMDDRDSANGGFGPAPKFPRTMSLEFLLTYAHYTKVESAKEHVRLSLHQMIRGGIYDHIGGGFARYATDSKWLVPHFEKMLYDNALLIDLLSKSHRDETDPEIEHCVRETISFLDRELRHPKGAYFAALDADSEGVEGKFYVWDLNEFKAVCGDKWSVWAEYLDISVDGNWEGANIPNRVGGDLDFAMKHGYTLESFRAAWLEKQMKLLAARSNRIRPGLDDKVILAWNALAVQSLLSAWRAFGEEVWLTRADEILAFIRKYMSQPEGGFFRIYAKESAYQDAFLEDYAFYIRALLERIQITFDPSAMEDVRKLMDWVIDQFYDLEQGAFKTTRSSELVSPLFDLYDGALPSGNAVMMENAYILYSLTSTAAYQDIAERLVLQMMAQVERFPGSLAYYAMVMTHGVFGRKEIVIAGNDFQVDLKSVLSMYLPGTVCIGSNQDGGSALLQNRVFVGKTYLYLCRGQSCQMPVEDLPSLIAML